MLTIANADGKPVQYRNFIRNRFTVREVVVSSTPLDADHEEDVRLEPIKHISADPNAIQDRSMCCGTMELPEYTQGEEALDKEIEEFKKSLKSSRK